MKRIFPTILCFLFVTTCLAQTRTLHGSLQTSPDSTYEMQLYIGTDEDGCDIFGGGIITPKSFIEAFFQIGDDSISYMLNGDVFRELNTFGELLSVDNATLEAAYRLIGRNLSENEKAESDESDEETRIIVIDLGKYLFDGGLDEDIASFKRVFRSEASAISHAAAANNAVSVSGGKTILDADTELVFKILRMYLDGLENDTFSSDEISCTLPWLLLGYSDEGTKERMELIEYVRNTLDEAENTGASAHVTIRISSVNSFSIEAEATNGALSAHCIANYNDKKLTFETASNEGSSSRVTHGVLTADTLSLDYTTKENGEETASGSINLDLANRIAERSVSEIGFNRTEILSIEDEKLMYSLVTGETAPVNGSVESKALVTRKLVFDFSKDELEYTANETVTERMAGELLLPGIVNEGSYSLDTHALIGNNNIVFDITDSTGDWIKLNAAYEKDAKFEIGAKACLYGTEFSLLELNADKNRFSLKSDRVDAFEEDSRVTAYARPWIDMYVNTENGVQAGFLYDKVMYTFNGEFHKGEQSAALTGKLFADMEEISDLNAGYSYTKDAQSKINGKANLSLPETDIDVNAVLSYTEKNTKLSVDVPNGRLPFSSLIIEYTNDEETTPVHTNGRALTADETAIMLDMQDRFISSIYGY